MQAPVVADPLGSGPAAFGREARHPLAGGRRVADVVATVVLLVVLAAESVVAGGGIVFLSLAFSSCGAPGNSCDETLGGAVVYAGPVLVALVLVAALVVCVLRLVRRRLSWPFALVGIAAVVAVFFGAMLLVDSAISHGI
ncbi:DUF6264 family protein [Curtobacterium sp. AB451]|jgi:hypothetical protein|uniref:DUF6264 family protein n=1 Tax=unclassified Curtobacterium TaxID=257496 RepID=UPI00034C1B8C|nr:DUF6264 family protein [Curtobacterium sp. B18]